MARGYTTSLTFGSSNGQPERKSNDQHDATEWDRFSKVTKGLVKVPKTKVDEKRQKD